MIVKEISEGIRGFIFPEKDGFDYGFNLYALQNGTDALVIDSAFRSQMNSVKHHLDSEGLQITHIVATHFHNDHVAGLMALNREVVVLGSPEYKGTLSKDIPQSVTPVSFSKPFRFGDFQLSFTCAPGHSPCSILTDINGSYLHVGDNLMSRYDGRRILPWVERRCLGDHIRSLEKLKRMGRKNILMGHGPPLEGEELISREINLRLHYLNRAAAGSPGLTLEEALPDNPENWVATEFFTQLMESSSPRK